MDQSHSLEKGIGSILCIWFSVHGTLSEVLIVCTCAVLIGIEYYRTSLWYKLFVAVHYSVWSAL